MVKPASRGQLEESDVAIPYLGTVIVNGCVQFINISKQSQICNCFKPQFSRALV